MAAETKVIYKKPDAFLCDFDTARWAYLLSREMEYAYRKTQKLYRKQTLQTEKALQAEEKLRQISEIYNQADMQIMDLIEEIKQIVK